MFGVCKAINGDKLDILVGQISSQSHMFDTPHRRNFVLTLISVYINKQIWVKSQMSKHATIFLVITEMNKENQ